MAQEGLGEPRSRVEGYYDNILGGDNDLGEPRSREEAYLELIAEAGGGGGGGGDLSAVGLTLSGRTLGIATDGTGGASVTLPPDEDTDTWLANTDQQAGYVAAGAGNAGRVWKTDAQGVPAWRDDADTTYQNATATTDGLMGAADKAKVDSFDVPSADAGVAVKTALADYTFAELSAVADEISALGESSGHYAEFVGYLGETFDFGAFEAGSTLADLCETDSIPELDRHVIAQLVGIRHDDLADGSGKAGLSFLANRSLPYAYQMNASVTNAGGWEQSKMRTTLNSGEVYQSLPSGLKDAAVAVLKQTNNTGGSSTTGAVSRSDITTTSDRFWLASAAEMWGANVSADSESWINSGNNAAVLPYEGKQYAYFANQGVTWPNYSALANRNQTNTGGTIQSREGSLFSSGSWLRSPRASSTEYFVFVQSSGQRNSNYTSFGRGVCLGFCLGSADRPTAVTASERTRLRSLGHALTLTVGGQTVTFDGTADASVATPAFVTCTQAEYDAMASHDPSTWYAIVEGE